MPQSAAASAAGGSASDVDWADLPVDLVHSIAAKLYMLDFVRLCAVCSSWRRPVAASPIRNKSMPYLLTAGKDGESSDSCVLLNLADGRTQRLAPLPEIRGKLCVGSQFGWLIVLDKLSNVSLLNPLTRSQIHLPLITTLPFIEAIHDPSDGALSMYLFHEQRIWPACETPVDYPMEDFRRISFRKVVLSSNPTGSSGGEDVFTVVAIFYFLKLILFIRPGEDKWNLLDEPEIFDDVIFFQGKTLAVDNGFGNVFALDLSCDPPKKTLFAKGLKEERETFDSRYLVDLSGDLLQICRSSLSEEEKDMYMLDEMDVMRWDPKEGSWCQLKSLGEHCLFVGTSYSTALSVHSVPGLKQNHIYFTDDAWDSFGNLTKGVVRDVGVYNVEDGSVEFYDHPDLQLKWPPPVWLTPTPWQN